MAKVVLITGISSGFGKATAELLSNKGYSVYGVSRNQREDLTGRIKVLQGDVTEVATLYQAVSRLVGLEGRIDILINNAGMGIAGSIEESSPEDIYLQMSTNFMGCVNMIKAVLPVMRRQRGATIVNISSVGGVMGLPFQGFYSASKFALEGLSEALRMELNSFKIRVIVIRPGDFFTGFTANRIPVKTNSTDSVYNHQFHKTLSIIEKDEKGGLSPRFFAKNLARILQKKNPCHHYVIATTEQKLAVVLKHLLPAPWFSAILSSHYGIK